MGSRQKVVSIQEKRSRTINEFGDLDRRIKEFKPVTERHRVLKEEIAGWFASHPADQPALAESDRYTIQLSPRAQQRSIISLAKIYRKIGQALFLKIATVPLKALDVACPDQDGLVVTERTGVRTVTAVAKTPIAA